MLKKLFNDHTAGWTATLLFTAITTFWFYWSVAEMYHEGWWGPFYIRLLYLIPGTAFLLLTLLGIAWPRVAGWLVVVAGAAFSIFFLNIHFVDGQLTIGRNLAGALVSVPVVLVGLLLLVEGRNRRQRIAAGWAPHPAWWRRNLATLIAVVPPALVLVGLSIHYLPIVLTRQDDGERGARLIEGNSVTLVWAPEGPGWNWLQDFGGYPSWNDLALYGVAPIGLGNKDAYGLRYERWATPEDMAATNLCLYLSEDGLSLADEAQYIWRMPTADELARSLTQHGANARCAWTSGLPEELACPLLPDKETPLWAPDLAPIYYWAADEYDEREAYFVSYNGWVQTALKSGGNPRHGYRCVREP